MKDSKIWKVFERKANHTEIAMVESYVQHAIPLLKLIRDTFPTYTLHDETHSENVLRLMEELLGDKVEELTALEGAILILSAYYHDIGMVFKEEEKNDLKREPGFERFLKEYPAAFVEVHNNNGEIPLDIAEWYCRWMHPERVHLFLNDDMDWGVNTLKEALNCICLSHGKNVDFLIVNDVLDTDFLYEADLKFCAILLRLADILDFDNSRSPVEIYDYIGVSKKGDSRESISNTEWRKHMDSDGFKFPSLSKGKKLTKKAREREERYQLGFKANCSSAEVEHNVRQFLDAIEDELSKCDRVLPSCSDRWREFKLPYQIDRKYIQGKNYKYGEFRFTLEQNQVLDLLMGENLYDDPYVFVRELLQNAIDTVRHRQFYEQNRGNTNYNPKVGVSTCYDDEGYQWVRFDDNGMGMNEHKILNYLLKVGRSYYNSSEFEAEKIGYKDKSGRNFTPISRFGIGILSCFLAGDQVEINTRHVLDDDAIRLSIPGMHGFYNMQSEKSKHTAALMPCKRRDEANYRLEAGTSIAVRLDPAKNADSFDIKEIMQKHILFPPVPIELEGEQIGDLASDVFDNSSFDEPIIIDLSENWVKKIEKELRIEFSPPPKIKIFCLNLTKHSPTPDLKGLFILCQLDAQYTEMTTRKDIERNIGITLGNNKLYVKLTCSYNNYNWRDKIDDTYTVLKFSNEVLPQLSIFSKYIKEHQEWISHNGIIVPTNKGTKLRNCYNPYYSFLSTIICKGVLALGDSLRPDISLARNRITSIPWQIYSAINLAYLKAVESYKQYGLQIKNLNFFDVDDDDEIYSEETFLLGNILKDPYIGIDKEWAYIPIITTDKGILSLSDIRYSISNKKYASVNIRDLPNICDILHYNCLSSFTTCCVAALVQIGLNLKLIIEEDSDEYIVDNDDMPVIYDGLKLFPPLFFVPYNNSNLLRYWNYPLNQNHPFSQWLIQKAPDINKRYPGMLQYTRNKISEERNYDKDIKDEINKTLDRLSQLAPDLAPPKDAYLKDEDFADEP